MSAHSPVTRPHNDGVHMTSPDSGLRSEGHHSQAGSEPTPFETTSLNDVLSDTLYEDLRRYAAMMLRSEPAERTLLATALVHEVIVRLQASGTQVPDDRGRFFALAASVLRHVLVDRARERAALKRGGDGTHRPSIGGTPALESVAAPNAGPDDDTILAIDEALSRLEKLDSRKAKVVVLRYFGGLDVDETAKSLGVSPRTVESDWRSARAYLARELAGLQM